MQLPDEEITTREVTQWQGVHLIHNTLSSCSQKVRILLDELGISYVSHPINLLRNEQRSDWYLGINPRGLVPVLVHNGVVHIESNDIIQYLNRQFASPDQSFLPETDIELLEMQTLMDLEDARHTDLRTVTFTYLAPDPSDHAPKRCEDDYGHISRFHDACCTLDAQLAGRSFLLGERMTLADISWFITLYRLNLAQFPMHKYPQLDAYFNRLITRPIFRKEVNAGPMPIRLAGALYRRITHIFRHSLAADYEKWNAENTSGRAKP